MPKKETIYLETSAVSAYFDFKNQDPERKKATRRFWHEILPDYNAFISEVVNAELTDTKIGLRRRMLLKLVANIKRLKTDKRTKVLAEKYIAAKIVPKSKLADAAHIAIASLNKVDYLVSWNQEHLIDPKQKKKIFEFNKKYGLFIPIISKPDDFFE